MARELDEGDLGHLEDSRLESSSRAESESGFTGSGSEPYSDEPVRIDAPDERPKPFIICN